jgi:type I restriction enzyme, S subunit
VSGLPNGWTVQPLRHLIHRLQTGPFGSALHKSDYVKGGIPIVNPQHLRNMRITPTEEARVGENTVTRLVAFKLYAGDIVLGRRGEMGRCAIVTKREQGWLLGTGSMAIRPSPGLDASYMLWILRSPQTVNALNRDSVGTTMVNLNQEILLDLPLMLPPVVEQMKIVEAVESCISRLDVAGTTLTAVQTKLKAYRASVLKAAVEGRLVPTEAELARAEQREYEAADVLLKRILAERRRRWEEAELAKMKAAAKAPKDDKWKAKYQEPAAPDTRTLPQLPEGWCWATIEQIVESTLLGLVRGRSEQRVSGHGWPYLKMDAIGIDGSLDTGLVSLVDATEGERVRYSLQPGDILFNTRNSVELVGKTALASIAAARMLFNNNIMRIRIVSGLNSAFVAHQMTSPPFRQRLERVKRATTSVAAIYQGDLMRQIVALAPLAEQIRIVEVLDTAQSQQDVAIRTCAVGRQRCSRLRQSILKWAFEGKLVDQDPNDEPAEKLLERLHAERAAKVPVKKTARRRKTKAAE